MNDDAAREVKLHYIDKLHANLTAVGSQINTAVIALVILCLVLVGLSAGWISLDHDYEIAGAKMKVARDVLLAAATLIVTLLQIHVRALSSQEQKVRQAITRLYKDLGFEDPSMADEDSSPLEHPNILTTALSSHVVTRSTLVYLLLGLAAFAALYVLPLVVQLFVAYAAFTGPDEGWIIPICAIVSIAFFVVYVLSTRDAPPPPARRDSAAPKPMTSPGTARSR